MSESPTTKTRRDASTVALALLCSAVLAVVVGAEALFWKQLEQTRADNAALANQVKALGGTPVVEPGRPGRAGVPGPQGRQGAPGPAPSAAQVASAVTSYCAGGRCAGKGPSVAQVASAVSAYCNAKGQCRGPVGLPGTQGSPGSNGSDGTAGSDGQQGPAGEQGPGPTDAQVASAVSAYCGQDTKPCQGPAGQTGDQGPKGDTGRGITSGPTCMGEGRDSYWLTKYSDGTEQRQDGPCRTGPAISLP